MPAPVALVGTAWTALLVADQPTIARSRPTAAFSADRIEGSTGCNRFGGSYDYADGSITFGAMMTTLMACDEDISGIERRYLVALGSATSAAVDTAGRLVIGGPDGSVIFEPASPPAVVQPAQG